MNLKVLKLRSGEEIACQVLEENDNFIKIHKPMVFKTMVSQDELGRIIDITSLHDWLMNTDSKDIELPLNHIAFRIEPNADTIKLYEMKSDREFNSKSIDTIEEPKDEKIDMNAFSSMLEDFLSSSEELFKNAMPENNYPAPKNKKKRKSKKSDYLPPDMTDERELDRHMIMMQLYIPAESIMNLVSSGILDPKTLLNMVDEVKKRNRFTGDEKDNKNFGNRFSDWNPDPNSKDYN
jgi:hypothetical protein